MAASSSGDVYRAHPTQLVAMVLIESPGAAQGHGITCYGALVVDLVEGAPRFALHHASASLDADRQLLRGELRGMCGDRHVVLGSAYRFEAFADHCHGLLDALALLDIVEHDPSTVPLDLTLVRVPERWMLALASAFDLLVGGGGGLAGMASYAGVRAQLVWLAYVSSTFEGHRGRSLFAAFRAWQALERARLLPI